MIATYKIMSCKDKVDPWLLFEREGEGHQMVLLQPQGGESVELLSKQHQEYGIGLQDWVQQLVERGSAGCGSRMTMTRLSHRVHTKKRNIPIMPVKLAIGIITL